MEKQEWEYFKELCADVIENQTLEEIHEAVEARDPADWRSYLSPFAILQSIVDEAVEFLSCCPVKENETPTYYLMELKFLIDKRGKDYINTDFNDYDYTTMLLTTVEPERAGTFIESDLIREFPHSDFNIFIIKITDDMEEMDKFIEENNLMLEDGFLEEDEEDESSNRLMSLVDEVIEEITKPVKNKKKTMYYALEIRVLADKTDVDYDEIGFDEWDFVTEVITNNVNGEDVEYLLKNKLNDDFPNNYVQVATMEVTDDPEELEEYLWK